MPQTTVAAIVTTKTTDTIQVLLTRRRIDPFKDYWCLPGGHIDQYESAETAICREVKEETGLDFRGEFFGYFDEIIPKHQIHAVVIVFEGEGKGQFQAQEDEVQEIAWFSLDKVWPLPLAFTHKEILRKWAACHSLK